MTDAIQPPTPATAPPVNPMVELMRPPQSLAELDVPASMLIDMILKILFNEGIVSLKRISEITRLEPQLIDEVLSKLQNEKLVEVAQAGQMGRFTYSYNATEEGLKRAREAFERTQYVGPMPVPVQKYVRAIELQTSQKLNLTPEQVKQALSHLILPDDFHRSIGPAINGGTSLFLYGPPGNGKTTVAEAVGKLLAGSAPGIWVPYAVTLAGYIISIYDPLLFEPLPLTENEARFVDKRWGKWKRPSVVVGGELTMEALELRYDSISKFYEAPLQMKANGGMFLIDDFGRQMMSPQLLLNRWIVPLETGIDFLRLRTGQALQIPFRQLIVFSTNLDPNELVDGAFLRRIQMKVAVTSPDDRMFFQIFVNMAKQYGIIMEKEGFQYLVQKWYREPKRKMQSVHPRDLCKIIRQICEYTGEEPRLTPELVDEACRNYFVDSNAAKDW
ncbi:MAG: AAA family ATPase [Phototrophicales bacterium]|nr:MAG: AAA family ATPase [Phototrophicales bacterium]